MKSPRNDSGDSRPVPGHPTTADTEALFLPPCRKHASGDTTVVNALTDTLK